MQNILAVSIGHFGRVVKKKCFICTKNIYLIFRVMSLEHTLTRMFKVITDIHTFFGISGKYFCLEVW